jgi:hypothetical protein
MSDILLLQERVKNTIQLGESHFREFKSALQGPPENKKPRLVKDYSIQTPFCPFCPFLPFLFPLRFSSWPASISKSS